MARRTWAWLPVLAVIVAWSIVAHPLPATAATVVPANSAPVLLSPASGTVVAEAPRLTWQADPAAVEYTVEVSSTAGFTTGTVRYGGLTTQTSFIPPDLGVGTFWWRVKALRVTNSFGPVSVARSFQLLPSLTLAPTLTAPNDGATFAYPASDLVLRWQPVDGATGYELEFATDASFTVNETTMRTLAPASLPPVTSSLLGTPVRWRVRPLSGYDLSSGHTREVGPWSAARLYTLTWSDVPVPQAPPSGATVASIVAEWTPVPGASGYDLQWTDASNPSFGGAQILTESLPYGPVPAPSGATAIWRVRAHADGGITGWSAVQTAIVDPAGSAPGSPVPPVMTGVSIQDPADGANVAFPAGTPIRWQPVPGAIGYQFQLTEAGQPFETVSPSAGFTTPSDILLIGRPMAAGTTYTWHIRAIGGDLSAGPWSDPRTLEVADTAGATLVSPAEGATIQTSSLLFAWSGPPTAPLADVDFSRTPDFATLTVRSSVLSDRAVFDLGTGTWYWRVRSNGYPAMATSETGSFTVVDDTPPAGFANLNAGSAYVPEGTVTVPLWTTQRDLSGAIAAVRLSWDGISWTSYPVTNESWSIDLPITSPEAGGSAPGPRNVSIEWEDDSGNRTAPQTATVWYAMQPPTPVNPPGAPTGVHATAGNGQVTVAWTAPLDDGGATITGYRVDVAPNVEGCSSIGALTCTVTGLSNGVAYTFTVTASNSAGDGAISAPSAAVSPRTVPDAPTGLGVVPGPGAGSATLSWIAPGWNGGASILGYVVSSSPGGHSCTPVPATATTCVVTGLVAGSPYSFVVAARNVAGSGALSEWVGPILEPSGPVAHITPLAAYVRSTTFGVAWGATPGTNGVAKYDVRVRRAAWNGGFGSSSTWLAGTVLGGETFTGLKGSTYCFSVRAHDAGSMVSAWTGETCTAVPLDDRSLARSASWMAGTNLASYAGTYLRSSTSGATLTRTGVVARSMAILVTTCPGCGTLHVYWQGVLVKTVSLNSTTIVHRKLITVATFASTRSGTLTLRISSSNRPVVVDGVAIRRT